MTRHYKEHRQGFSYGYTSITQADESVDATGMDFGILRLQEGESVAKNLTEETAYLLMDGKLCVHVNHEKYEHQRSSVFDEAPFAVHASRATDIVLVAKSDVELALFSVPNEKTFSPRVFCSDNVSDEHRGEGQVGNTCLRYVRTIFDGSNSPPESLLVLGEVVNLPGRWSSYPPHHHPQPEIYHYRFSHLSGFGHAELGEEVVKVRHNDTVKILDGVDHPQCSAPGYGMYYIWVIRHLATLRYTQPEFTEDHVWIMEEREGVTL